MTTKTLHCDMKRCGGGCTQEQYEAAMRGADTLISLLPPGWKESVHENLGWFYEAVSPCGRLSVSPRSPGLEGFKVAKGSTASKTGF